MWLIKTNAYGTEEWNTTSGDTGLNTGESIQQTDDDGYIIAGVIEDISTASYDWWIIKTDADGVETWNYSYGSMGYDDICYSVKPTTDGCYVFTGFTTVVTPTIDVFAGVSKMDVDGNVIWSEVYGSSQDMDLGFDIEQTSDSGYIVVGARFYYVNYTTNVLLMKLEPEENQPPGITTITGPLEGEVGVSYIYTFTATDPNNDQLYYYIDWGDGHKEEWIGAFPSGVPQDISHIWSDEGDYVIRAKAKDIYSAEGPYGNLTISMPVSQHIPTNSYLLKLIMERFPNIYIVLQYILKSIN